ncbi:MAG: hypothetical protein LIO79_06845 [Rikenellaceae bacterium]|nr:hypothetical protein [Rikenellaceae bacterium]
MYRLTPEEKKILDDSSSTQSGKTKIRIASYLILAVIFVSMVLAMNYCIRTISYIERNPETILESEP